ncbi:MAG: hypothetical protein KDD44_06570 [Bdellovibrionales bacterium]|nr:hypothetical protein [Bdellovibrionales bacterium]
MTKILLVIIGLVAVGAVIEYLGRSKREGQVDDEQEFLTAAEAGPTQTGRFRVQQMLEQTGERAPHASEGGSEQIDDDETALPDPFDPER